MLASPNRSVEIIFCTQTSVGVTVQCVTVRSIIDRPTSFFQDPVYKCLMIASGFTVFCIGSKSGMQVAVLPFLRSVD